MTTIKQSTFAQKQKPIYMKKSFFTLLSIISIVTINAQLKVKQYGQLQIGTESSDVSSISPSLKDTISKIQVFGPYGEMGEGGRITFGDAALADNYNVIIGELGDTDCDKLWLHGKRGAYLTTTSNASDTIAYFDVEKGRYVQFNCDVKTTGIFVRSDSKFKEDIKSIENAGDLWNLNAVSYKLKPETFTKASNNVMRTISNGHETSKGEKDRTFFEEYYNNLQNQPTRFGFIAQEVNKFYPELVRTDSLGYMYVDYMGMIPLLVEAVKELKTKCASLESQITNGTPIAEKVVNLNSSIKNTDILNPCLNQNIPNPFSTETTIGCHIPENINNADLYIFDMQGTTKMKLSIQQRGSVQICIEADKLPSGMYIYSLICDNQEIDCKKMIITK